MGEVFEVKTEARARWYDLVGLSISPKFHGFCCWNLSFGVKPVVTFCGPYRIVKGGGFQAWLPRKTTNQRWLSPDSHRVSPPGSPGWAPVLWVVGWKGLGLRLALPADWWERASVELRKLGKVLYHFDDRSIFPEVWDFSEWDPAWILYTLAFWDWGVEWLGLLGWDIPNSFMYVSVGQ